jgi:hypothetical protein
VPGDKYDGDIEVDLVRPLQRSPSSLISHRGCAYLVSEVYPIIDAGQTGRNGKEGVTRRVTAEEGGVYECVADGYSS